MTELVLAVDHLSKRYRQQEAVRDVSLTVQAGERVALLGHNGAGKTTLMKTILGLTRPSAGRITVLGHAPGSKAARRVVAYLPEHVVFQSAVTGAELMTDFARLKRAPVQASFALLERVGLGEAAHRRIGTYSKGMRQRLALAQALIGEPRLLLLDEPTSGLDPVLRQAFYELLGELAAKGAAVVVSSHVLTELEARTERVAIMREGRLVVSDSLTALRQRAQLPIRIRLDVRPGAVDGVAAALNGRQVNGQAVELICTQDDKMSVLGRITGLGDAVQDVELALPSLDDIYRHFGHLDTPGEEQER